MLWYLNSYFDYCLQSTQILLILENINANGYNSPIHIANCLARSKPCVAEKRDAMEEKEIEGRGSRVGNHITVHCDRFYVNKYNAIRCVCLWMC